MRNVVYRTLLQTSTYINEIGNRQAEKKKTPKHSAIYCIKSRIK